MLSPAAAAADTATTPCWVQISSEDLRSSANPRASFHGFLDDEPPGTSSAAGATGGGRGGRSEGSDGVGARRALQACALSATPRALGGMFAAVCTSTGIGVCTVCTDFMGRQPLYYRLVSSARGCGGGDESDGLALQLSLHRPVQPSSSQGSQAHRWVQHCPRMRLVWEGGGALVSRHVHLPDILMPQEAPAIGPFTGSDEHQAAAELAGLLRAAVAGAWRASGAGQVGVLFSGGVDSCLVAKLLAEAGADVHLFTAGVGGEGLKEPEDLTAARDAAQELGLPLHEALVSRQELGPLLERLAPVVEDLNVVKAGVAATMALACQAAATALGPGPIVMFSGLGTEECWAGYLRFATAGQQAASALGLLGLQDMWHRDLQRDHAAASVSAVTIVHPFLDKRLLSFAVGRVPGSLKLGTDGTEKLLLRRAAGLLGLPARLTRRPKRAAQYGSRVHYALDRLRPRVYGGQEKVTKVGTVMGLPGASHSTFALLAHGAAGAAHALRTCRLLRVPLACLLLQDGMGELSEAACRALAAIHGLPVDDSAHFPSRLAIVSEARDSGRQSRSEPHRGMVEALRGLKRRWPVAGLISCAVSDLSAQTALSHACDAAGLKVVAPVWGASPPGRLVAQACSEGQEVHVLRAPETAVASGALPLVLRTPAHAQKFTECVEEAQGGSSDPDSGLTELLVLPAGHCGAQAEPLPVMEPEESRQMRPWKALGGTETGPTSVREVAAEGFRRAVGHLLFETVLP